MMKMPWTLLSDSEAFLFNNVICEIGEIASDFRGIVGMRGAFSPLTLH